MEQTTNTAGGVVLTLEAAKAFNYALHQNRIPLVRLAEIDNRSGAPLRDVTLSIGTEPAFCRPCVLPIDCIGDGETLRLRTPDLPPDDQYLAGLTEGVRGLLRAELRSKDGALLAQVSRDMQALAFDEWTGAAFCPEVLAAYVTPNHPAVQKITARAAALLETWTGDPSLDGYQSGSRDRVLLQCAAIYGALQELNIVYAVPPASFEPTGQRIRLCDAVLDQKMGTCMDLTLLCAACMEAVGLRPLLLLGRSHILPGVWLRENAFPESVGDDLSLVTKRMADGIGEIAAFESTCLAAGGSISFDGACAQAARQLHQAGRLDTVIDIFRARISGVRPLPQRVRGADGWQILREPRGETALTPAPAPLGEAVEIVEAPGGEPSRLVQWERRLLDLDMRNTLLNMRPSKTLVPLFAPALSGLESALTGGGELGILARPAECPSDRDPKDPEAAREPGPLQPLLEAEFQNGRLRALFSDGELHSHILALSRAARVSLEENGANTLFLALGLLRWYEPKKSAAPHYAPLVLLPVDLVRRSTSGGGYILRLREEEPQMNITLLEMLRQNFDLRIEGLDPLPRRGEHIDLRAVFAVLRQAVMDRKDWDVVETAFLGIFSFSRFVMWNDMRQRRADLLENKVVRSLTEGRLVWPAKAMEKAFQIPESGLLLPLPADASQLRAVAAAVAGESFVLHGPPGTGKSQTITTMIVNALAQGKTVLFVAEKMAALSVVQKRLEEIGVGDFCLELHSSKSRKKDVLGQLQKVSELTRDQAPAAWQKQAEESRALRAELDAYAEALHAAQPCGRSAFLLIGDYEANAQWPDLICLDAQWAASLSADDLAQLETLLERLTAAARAVGHPAGHPLRYIGRSRYDHRLKAQLPQVLDACEAAAAALEEALSAFTDAAGLPMPRTRADAEALRAAARELPFWLALPAEWTASADPDAYGVRVCRSAMLHALADARKETLLAAWNEPFLRQDGAALLAEWQEISSKWALPRAAGMASLRRRMAPFARQSVPEGDGLARSFMDLDAYVSLCRQAAETDDLFAAPGHEVFSRSEPALTALAEETSQSARRLYALTGSDDFRRRCCIDAGLLPLAERLEEAFAGLTDALQAADALLELQPADPQADWPAGLRTACRDIRDHADEMKEWMIWNGLAEEARGAGLGPAVDAYLDGAGHETVAGSWHKALYRCLAEQAIDASGVLCGFSGALFNEKLAQFRRMDERLTALSRQEAFSRLAAGLPDFTEEACEDPEIAVLHRAIRSGGRGMSIRRLFEQIPGLLARLCPCMLMSPLSAAQYLGTAYPPFDLVIFDEASQLPTCRAIGALSRGRSAVIVGDPNQMPPTSFFMGQPTAEDDPEAEDLESILDDCLAIHMPETHLLWHYRSRHESLIAFSNSRFYDGRLLTFPSPGDRESRVRLVHVNGVFDRGHSRSNQAEADAVVAELRRRCHDPALQDKSVGVVAFNIHQQDCIEDTLNAACAADPELDRWVNRPDEPVFIKNLENVQGDERDVILFSVGFGPDAGGRIYMNFGPLNREGGWRRLNVAVSRARCEMVVFSTLHPADIDLGRTASEGVAALRAFLEYAGGRPLALTTAQLARRRGHGQPGGVARAICRALAANGYETACAVGHSACRVDVGVVDPAQPDRYLLGILLDGESYTAAANTRDREIGQTAVLEDLGWDLLRVWSMDWWDNSAKELRRILDRLDRLQTPLPQPQPAPAPLPPSGLTNRLYTLSGLR